MPSSSDAPHGASTDPAAAAQTLAQLGEDLRGCRQCALHAHATQAVMGRGPVGAHLLLVGEQPGADEDVAGRPFVGPAGRLLQEAMDVAGIDRDACFWTYANKHFKSVRRGRVRLPQRPYPRELAACRNWLVAELRLVQPKVVLCLGANAGQSLFGPSFRVGQSRGQRIFSTFGPTVATVQPAAILRLTCPAARKAALRAFVFDLQVAWRWATGQPQPLPLPATPTDRPPPTVVYGGGRDRPTSRGAGRTGAMPPSGHERRPP